MALKLITPPVAEPLDLATAKLHLRVDQDDENTLITNLITTAREQVEHHTRRALVTQTWELILFNWPSKQYIELPLPPLQSASIKYYGTDDTEYPLAATDYTVEPEQLPGRITLNYAKSWPTVTLRPARPIVVTFTAGYLPQTEQEHTGEVVGTGDDLETDFALTNTPIVADSETIYLDGTAVDPADYTLDDLTGALVFGVAPGEGVAITADYIQSINDLRANVPQAIKQAMLLLIGDMWEHREARLEVKAEDNPTVMRLLWHYRVFGW